MTRYESTEDGVRRALEALGDTPEAIAKALDAAGIRGVRGHCSWCPVAEYLAQAVGGSVSVHAYEASVEWQRTSVKVRLPCPLAVFLDGFDMGEYPGLEAES